MNAFALWLAQGFGVGRIPFAPGTFGSLVGLLWMAMLTLTESLWGYLGGMFGGLAASVWLGGKAERILRQKDASSIVIDEIASLPICFVPWILSYVAETGGFPPLKAFLQPPSVYMTIGLVVLFRVFDIAKLWPAARLERWPGGWGVTADDVMAAVYVGLVCWVVLAWG